MNSHPIVVVGGGFGGVYTTKRLLKKGYQVVLVSRSPHFTFTPLLHEVATGSLVTHDIAFSYESFFHSPSLEFVGGDVTRIEPQQKRVWMGDRVLEYSMLVIATGSRTNERLIRGMEHAYELKIVEDAQRVKKAMITKAQGPDKSVNVTVIGGGPTGSELVFDAHSFLMAIKKQHPELRFTIRLIHAKKDIGGSANPYVQAYINHRIIQSGIDVVREALAEEITPTHVTTNKGVFASDVTIVAAGVRPNTDVFVGALPMDLQGHICVDPTLRVRGMTDVFALGDVITIENQVVPKLAQTAVQQASIVADNIVRQHQNLPLRAYQLRLKGFLLSLGYGDGVGDLLGVIVKGPLAWYIWRTIYLFKTPGFKNKLRVAFSWTIGLFTGRDLTSL